MKRYTIYCTPEQTKKAFELGAPIDNSSNNFDSDCSDNIELLSNGLYAIIPTAEQMVCWLEEQGLIVTTDIGFTTEWYSYVKRNRELLFLEHRFSTRKEATLTAIDAALDYLTNHKKAI